jgi:hypothetical protein
VLAFAVVAVVIRQQHVKTWTCATPFRLKLLHHHAQPQNAETTP